MVSLAPQGTRGNCHKKKQKRKTTAYLFLCSNQFGISQNKGPMVQWVRVIDSGTIEQTIEPRCEQSEEKKFARITMLNTDQIVTDYVQTAKLNNPLRRSKRVLGSRRFSHQGKASSSRSERKNIHFSSSKKQEESSSKNYIALFRRSTHV